MRAWFPIRKFSKMVGISEKELRAAMAVLKIPKLYGAREIAEVLRYARSGKQEKKWTPTEFQKFKLCIKPPIKAPHIRLGWPGPRISEDPKPWSNSFPFPCVECGKFGYWHRLSCNRCVDTARRKEALRKGISFELECIVCLRKFRFEKPRTRCRSCIVSNKKREW